MDRFVNKKIEKQTIYEIYRACRLCGAGGGYKMPIIQNVVNLDNCDVELKQKIRECVQIEVHQDDRMPPLICELCVDKVNDFYEFLEMCRQTNKRTRLKLGLPPQMLPRGAPDAGDCILGVTEPVFVNDEDSNEPLSDKRSKAKGGKFKKEPEKWKDVKIKVEKVALREARSSRHRAPSPPRLRRDKRPNSDNVALSRLQYKVKKSQSPPPKSILKKGNKPEPSPQSPTTRLKRSREPEVKHETPSKRVKISLTPLPSRSSKLSPRHRKEMEERKKAKRKEVERQARELHTPCLICGVVLKTPQAMLSHRRCHVVTYTNPKLACNACGLWFRDAEEAETHHKRHRRQGLRYRCRRCSLSATTQRAYEEHIENGKCTPWEEVPDVKCEVCWKTFPTQNLLDGHRCPGVRARPGKCVKCGKNYATQKSLAHHVKFCKKGDVVISPELRRRLIPMRVWVAKCDPLLANVKQEHYDVSGVGTDYGLDQNCVYPYISSGLRIKSEPSDCMVKINDMDCGGYLHWDSDEDSGDSDADNLDSLDLSVFMKRRKVNSLAACALKTIFSNKFLGKVPRKYRRLKIENIIDSTLNDSLSDLNLNDSDAGSLRKNGTVSDSTAKVSDKKFDDKEDDLFSKVNSDKQVTNDDFDSLFSGNNYKSDSDDSGNKSTAVTDDKLASLEIKNSDESDEKNIEDSEFLDRGGKEKLDDSCSFSVTIINKKIDVIESVHEMVEENVSKEKSSDSENQLDVNANDSEQKGSLKTHLRSYIEKKITDDGETNISEIRVGHHNENINRGIPDEVNQQEDANKTEELLENHDSDTSVIESKPVHENNDIVHTDSDKEINIEKSAICTQELESEVTEKRELNIILETGKENSNKDTRGNCEEDCKNNSEQNITENNVDKDPDDNFGKSQVNGEAEVDDGVLNMNDFEDLSGAEYDDCELMAEIDEQIGEKKREGVRKEKKTDERGSESEKSTDVDKEIVHKDVVDRKRLEVNDKINDETTTDMIKEKEDNEADPEIKEDKIMLEDLLPKEEIKPMDLDNISDEEFDFNN